MVYFNYYLLSKLPKLIFTFFEIIVFHPRFWASKEHEMEFYFFLGFIGCIGPQGWREQKLETVFGWLGCYRDNPLGDSFTESA